MADADIKIGITTTGDPAGAKVVEDALKDTIDATRELPQAGEGLGDLNSQLGSLLDAVGGFSQRDARGTINGLTNAITGLAAGDNQKGLGGLVQMLMSVARAIPLPAAAVTAMGAAFAVGIYRMIACANAAHDALDELGQKVDEEVENIAAWAAEELELSVVTSGFEGARKELDATKTVADSLLDTIKATFDRTYSLRIQALQDEVEALREAGQADAAARLEEQINRAAQTKELVDNTVKLHELKTVLSAQVRQIELQQQAFARREEMSLQAVQRMDALREQIVERTGTDYATFEGSISEKAREGLVENITKEIHGLERRVSQRETAAEYDPMLGALQTAAHGEIAEIRAQIEGLREFRRTLLDFDKIADAAAKGQTFLAEESLRSMEEIDKAIATAVSTRQKVDAAEGDLQKMFAEATQEVQADATAEADAILRAALDAQTQIMDAVSQMTPAAAVVGDVSAGAAEAVVESMWRLGDGFKQAKQNMPDFADLADSTAEGLSQASGHLRSAAADITAGAASFSEGVDATASAFDASISSAGGTLDGAGKKLSDTADSFLGSVQSMASAVDKAVALAQAALDRAERAAAAAALASAQIRNAR